MKKLILLAAILLLTVNAVDICNGQTAWDKSTGYGMNSIVMHKGTVYKATADNRHASPEINTLWTALEICWANTNQISAPEPNTKHISCDDYSMWNPSTDYSSGTYVKY